MSLVDLNGVSASLFLTLVLFLLLFFGLLSFGILKMFQLRFRSGWFSFAGAIAAGALFYYVVERWYA